MKLPYFSLNMRLIFSDLFRIWFRIRIWIRIRIRIRNVYFGSGSDPAKSFGSLRIRFRIRNTASVTQRYGSGSLDPYQNVCLIPVLRIRDPVPF